VHVVASCSVEEHDPVHLLLVLEDELDELDVELEGVS
jgi:hypothetical protein